MKTYQLLILSVLILILVSCGNSPQKTTVKSAENISSLIPELNLADSNFNDFIEQNGLKGKDDEAISYELVQSLSREMFPRVIIEHFP